MNWKRNDRRSERNLCNCVSKKPKKKKEKFRTSAGFEPVYSRYRCDALPTELWSHWRWEKVNCGFIYDLFDISLTNIFLSTVSVWSFLIYASRLGIPYVGVKRYLKRYFITNLFQATRKWCSRTVKSDAKNARCHSPLQIGASPVFASLILFFSAAPLSESLARLLHNKRYGSWPATCF